MCQPRRDRAGVSDPRIWSDEERGFGAAKVNQSKILPELNRTVKARARMPTSVSFQLSRS